MGQTLLILLGGPLQELKVSTASKHHIFFGVSADSTPLPPDNNNIRDEATIKTGLTQLELNTKK